MQTVRTFTPADVEAFAAASGDWNPAHVDPLAARRLIAGGPIVHGMHALPGMELTGADPERPSSEVIAEYFDRYERAFDLRVRRPVDVRAVREGPGGRLLVESSAGTWSTVATSSSCSSPRPTISPVLVGRSGA